MLDCPRKPEKIISRYPSSHYIIDPCIVFKIQLLRLNARENKCEPVLKILKEDEYFFLKKTCEWGLLTFTNFDCDQK